MSRVKDLNLEIGSHMVTVVAEANNLGGLFLFYPTRTIKNKNQIDSTFTGGADSTMVRAADL